MNAILMNLQIVAMDWSLESFLVNLLGKVKLWGSGIIMVLGAVAIIVAVWQLFKGFTSGGKGQVNWAMAIGCGIFGGFLLFGGWNLISKVSKGAGSSIETIGNDNSSDSLSEGGEGITETIILPFGNTTAYIDMK